MGVKNQRGFTIVEVMLFLGLSALLAVGLLAGWTTMLNTQRYKDSNKTLQSFMQQQYNLVYNVENARDKEFICNAAGVAQDAGGVDRGQTDCVIMGRYIHIADGQMVRVYPIVGYEPANPPTTNDTDSIAAYQPKRATEFLDQSESELLIPWQATVMRQPDDDQPQNAVIVIVRSPLTGVVHTYRLLTAANNIFPDITTSELLSSSTNYESSDMVLCLESGAPLTGPQQGIVVEAYASSQSAIRPTSDKEGSC